MHTPKQWDALSSGLAVVGLLAVAVLWLGSAGSHGAPDSFNPPAELAGPVELRAAEPADQPHLPSGPVDPNALFLIDPFDLAPPGGSVPETAVDDARPATPSIRPTDPSRGPR